MAAPKAHINVSGTWKQINKIHVNVSGTWKRVNNAYVNVSGTWKKFLSSVSPSSFSGALNATAVTNTIITPNRTYTLGAGNSGRVMFTSVMIDGSTFMYSKNSGAYVDITEGLTITLANTDTLNLRGQSMTPAGTSNSCDVYDYDTGILLDSAFVTRS